MVHLHERLMMLYDFVLKGLRPIIFHADDVVASDVINDWRKNPDNKGVSVPGDDRSPAWTWTLYLYSDGENVAIPHENILACLLKAGTQIPKNKGKGTFKSESQSGLLLPDPFCRFTSGGKQIKMAAIASLRDLPFKEQFDAVQKLGFELKVKRAAVGQAKHVRVRPMWHKWEIQGQVDVIDPTITSEVLGQMFAIAGQRVGLLDWRPSAPKKPGPYGTFKAEVKAAK